MWYKDIPVMTVVCVATRQNPINDSPCSEKNYRTGLWNGLGYSGAPELKPNPLFNFEFVSNKDEVYYNCYLKNEFAKSRVVVDQTNGYTRNRYVCNSGTQSWEVFMSEPRDNCDRDDLCGAYGNCIIGESPVCKCLKGFKLKGNFMDCWNLKECKARCLDNCSCTAYMNANICGGGSGCFKWFRDLNDIREFQDSGGGSDCFKWFGDLNDIREFQDGGQDLCVRMHASELVVCCANIKCEGANGEDEVKIALEGTLEDGQEIDVKKLAWGSRQGENEFKNELFEL
ncbi:G-type lectin S-receptor-like serine/threonine-protein kinase At4g27290 [Ziziphus jujuba]|uniref:G-type lectin S-receptor-like serine/threonine-protein kinase At4g27290 n=1 Tax=Ziziphus jujuba TaxID=326968 RepID=A0ABM3I954_ZIZJJ|nr:G-type lectin S-receptor-like serine/threonine-protein kinase At4g27290 [Ziziphus jujuba]